MTREIENVTRRGPEIHACHVARAAMAVWLTLVMVQSATSQLVPVDQHAEVVRDKVVSIGQGGKTTIEMLDGRKYHGEISAINVEILTLDEVDLNQKQTLHYQEVKRVQAGYMQRSLFTGKRRDPKPLWVQVAVLSGFLFGLLGIGLLLHQR